MIGHVKRGLNLAEGYEVEAFRYLLKPLQREKLWEALDLFLVRRRRGQRYWTVETPEGQKRVAPAEILYLESFGHTCLLYTPEACFQVKKGISEIEKELGILGRSVYRTHRSYLVNLAQVTAVGRDRAALAGGSEVPVSRTQYQGLNRAFIRQFRREG
ncbi:MAG: LytTR family transcriptional regulator [Lachnospiraceae bacterium]|nr:LytTR family transcriptional regulator [Lachnospiraceae bacterium]